MIGGRPISTYELNDPIQHQEWSVRCIEVASPKPGRGSSHGHGLEHAEVVVGADIDSPLHSQALLQAFMAAYPEIHFDTRALDKELNADVSIILLPAPSSPPDGNTGDMTGPMSVKFH
ncbi:unnamed protein product, partial [Symbiodinium microadriaticum]